MQHVAQARGNKTIEALMTEIIEEVRDPQAAPRYYETDDWLRHLRVSEERIQRLNAEDVAE